MRGRVGLMKGATDFIMKNWRLLAPAYIIVAVLIFCGGLFFFWCGWREMEKEKELWSDFQYDYPEDSENPAPD